MDDDDRRMLRDRLHILDALVMAGERRSELFALVDAAESADAACELLESEWVLDEFQARAIVDLQVRRFAAMEFGRIVADRDAMRREVGLG